MKNVSKCAKFLRKDWIPRINGINQTDRHTFSQTYNKKNIKKKWLKATGQKEHLKNSWTYPLTNTDNQTHSHTLRYRPTHKHWQPDPLTNTEKQTPHKHWQTDPLTYTDKQIPHIHWQTNPLTYTDKQIQTLTSKPTHIHWQTDPLTYTDKQTPSQTLTNRPPHIHWQTDPLTNTDKQTPSHTLTNRPPHIHWHTTPSHTLTNKPTHKQTCQTNTDLDTYF